MRSILKKDLKGQVWVETVIYTLIALGLIGAVLAFAKPKIEEMQDKAIIEQSLVMLENIDSQILSAVQGGEGNKRIVELNLKKGEIYIETGSNRISYSLTGGHKYSEIGAEINVGKIKVTTKEEGRDYEVLLILDYGERYDITFNGVEIDDPGKILPKASTPYKLSIENKGGVDKINIDIKLV